MYVKVMVEVVQHNRTQWVTYRRRSFMEHRLFWCGQLGLSDLMDAFDLSRAQASKELNAYKKAHPGNIFYDLNAKTYVPRSSFVPEYDTPNSERYLNDLLELSRGKGVANADWYSLRPEVFSPPVPARGVKPETLQPVMRAIDSNLRLSIRYQSMSSPTPKIREIAPHALCFDGFRWHARAYCFQTRGFRDFVISRMLGVQLGSDAGIDQAEDSDWDTKIELEIVPHPELSVSQRKVVELDYGMENGSAFIQVRKSMLFYALRRLGLDDTARSRPAHQQHIVLADPSSVPIEAMGAK